MGAVIGVAQGPCTLRSPIKKHTTSSIVSAELDTSTRLFSPGRSVTQHVSMSRSTVKLIARNQLHRTIESFTTNSFLDSSTVLYPDGDGVLPYLINQDNTPLCDFISRDEPSPVQPKPTKPSLKVIVSEDDGDRPDAQSLVINDIASNTGVVLPPSMYRSSSNEAVYVGPLAIGIRGIEVRKSQKNCSEVPHPHAFLSKGRYDFVHVGKLGCGNSGTVVEALHVPTLTIVALKMLRVCDDKDLNLVSGELSVLCQNLAELRLMDERLGERSDNESDIMETTETTTDVPEITSPCPQLLAMYDAFLDPISGMVNLVVEYMDGGSLQDVVDNGGCRDEEVLADIAHQVLLGLDFLHSHNQMHRDIKPGNILLNCQGQVKLADFGISRVHVSKHAKTDFSGTVNYMAPERILNKPYDLASDLWSFGLTLLAVICGQFPLVNSNGEAAADYWDLLRLICEDDVRPPGDQFSVEFNALIESCIEKDPTARPTVRQLLGSNFFEKHVDVVSAYSLGERNSTVTENGGEGTNRCNGSPPRSHRTRLSVLTSRSTALSRGASRQIGDDLIAVSEADNDKDMYDMHIDHLHSIFDNAARMYEHPSASVSKSQVYCSTSYKDQASSEKRGRDFKSTKSDDMQNITNESPQHPVSKTALRRNTSLSDRLCRLPSCDEDVSKWRHLAQQLNLPLNSVLYVARNTVKAEFFERGNEFA